jgi:hypothetical protein
MSTPLVSLREAAEDFNAGKCQLRTEMLVRIGDAETRWELVVETEWEALRWGQYDDHGRPLYQMLLYRADAFSGEPESRPDEFWGLGPRDVGVIAEVFGINPDARVWTKGTKLAKE